MQKRLLFLLFIIPILGFSQCPDAPITLSSQAEVDAFTTNYPDCTELTYYSEGSGSLTISGADITDLTPLSSITYTPYLRISNNPSLILLNGLHNLQSAVPNSTKLSLVNNPLLTNLSAFTGLTFINGLGIDNCSSLTNLEGLNFVTDFGDAEIFGLGIRNNDLLTDISALSNITNFNNIYFSMNITNNPVLSSLNGLQGFSGVYEYLNIINNDSLINLIGLNNFTFAFEGFYIADNDNLVNLIGLDSVVADVFFENNASLQNLVGLTSSVNEGSFFSIRLIGNASLQSLQGLEVATDITYLLLDGNESLTDISALPNFTPPSTSIHDVTIEIRNNMNLATCHVESICSALSTIREDYYWYISIENNAEGCRSQLEVEYSCDLAPSNDECEDAVELTLGETIVAYNELTTASTQTPSCNDVNRVDVWFTLNSGSFTSVDVIAEAGYFLQLWEGECASLTQVASACSGTSLNDIPVTTNTDYYVQVWSDGTNRRSTGLFDILVQDGTLTTQEFAFNGFTMYPNPVNNRLNFKANQNITAISIYSLLGQHVMQTTPNTIQTELNLSNLQTGIYLVKVKIGEQTATYKVIKE